MPQSSALEYCVVVWSLTFTMSLIGAGQYACLRLMEEASIDGTTYRTVDLCDNCQFSGSGTGRDSIADFAREWPPQHDLPRRTCATPPTAPDPRSLAARNGSGSTISTEDMLSGVCPRTLDDSVWGRYLDGEKSEGAHRKDREVNAV